jgi:hypothetical protein
MTANCALHANGVICDLPIKNESQAEVIATNSIEAFGTLYD